MRERVELIEVIELSLPAELGTGGRPRRQLDPVENNNSKMDYTAFDLFSDEALSEEILFQGRLNKL